jgi:monoamine oxidase
VTVRLAEPAVVAAASPRDIAEPPVAGGELASRHVVLAIPPSLVRTIAVALPAPAQTFVEAVRLGRVVKCFAGYDRPFWRDAGFSGEAYHPRGTVRATVALESDGPAILLAFIVGRAAIDWAALPAIDRRRVVIETFVDQFGTAAASPLDYTEVDWGADPWSGGCVAGLPPHVLSAGAAWRAPHGRIHIAGTESAVAWPGYLEGAIEAGERAASEILQPK